MLRVSGFILQSTYRLESGRPVVHLYGRLIDGRTFLIRDSRLVPHIFIRSEDAHRLSFKTLQTTDTDWTTLDGYPATRIDFQKPSDVPFLRRKLEELHVNTYQADVRFAVEFLIQRNIRGGCVIEGESSSPIEGVDLVFEDPHLEAADESFSPRVLSFDIETDPDANRLLAISLYSPDIDEVLIVDPNRREPPPNSACFDSERAVLQAFQDRLQSIDPDVLTGWNVIDFDINVLNRIADRLNVALDLGRLPGRTTVREAQGYFGSGQAIMPGRLVLDGIDLVRGAFMRFDEYSLEAVAQKELGEGKAVLDNVEERASEILDRYHEDLPGFADYARSDARLAYQIVEKLNLIPLAVARSKLTGMMMDRVAASIASFDFVYMAELRKRQICAPTVGSGDMQKRETHAGGHVLEPVVGIHENTWVLDFRSLYPSIIRTFNIDPLAFVHATKELDSIELLNGAAFDREPAILPNVLAGLFEQRAEAKARDDQVASQAIKILMNSFYGVLVTPACRFHNSKLGNSITTMGRHFLLWAKSWFEEQGHQVLYGDTDSVFVSSGISDPVQANERGIQIVDKLNDALTSYIENEWHVENKLELEFEKLYLKLFLLPLRHGTGGARKRYAGSRYDKNGEVEFIGMEVVRRDWTELAKDVQRELYRRLFEGEKVEDYLRTIVDGVRNGDFDEKLIYRKGLNRPLDRYVQTKTLPPHVRAAKKSNRTGRVVRYVITEEGPEPIDNIEHKLDRDHYVDKQVKAIADPVLKTLGLDFDQIISYEISEPLFANQERF